MYIFCSKTLFWHPDKLPNIIFTPIFKTPTKHYEIWENKQTKSWTDFRRNLGQIFNSRNGKSWTDFQLYSM